MRLRSIDAPKDRGVFDAVAGKFVRNGIWRGWHYYMGEPVELSKEDREHLEAEGCKLEVEEEQ